MKILRWITLKTGKDRKEIREMLMPRGRPIGARDRTTKLLLKIFKEKVVSETEMIKIFGDYTKLKVTYKSLVSLGFPIMKKELEHYETKSRTTGSHRSPNHRTVIYYFDERKMLC